MTEEHRPVADTTLQPPFSPVIDMEPPLVRPDLTARIADASEIEVGNLVPTSVPPQAKPGMAVVVGKADGSYSLEASGRLIDAATGALGAMMKRSFRESRALATTKLVAGAGAFAAIGGGYSFKMAFAQSSNAFVEFISPSPGAIEICVAAGIFFAAVGADLYAQRCRRTDEQFMWKMAMDPSLRGAGQDALLAKLAKPDD